MRFMFYGVGLLVYGFLVGLRGKVGVVMFC